VTSPPTTVNFKIYPIANAPKLAVKQAQGWEGN